MKVLLFSNDLMPFGELPTSGGGLRCWQLMKGLESRGIEVHASMPGFTYLAEKHYAKIPQAQRDLLWQWHTQDDILRAIKPDAVLFASNWDHFNLTKSFNIPLIVDLHGSRLIETTMWNNPVSTDKKVEVFAKADCLLAAGKRQRKYFYGWLLQAGRVPGDEHFIRYIPISLSPKQPEHLSPSVKDPSAPRFVSGGGWFPWQNQSKAIFAVCQAVAERQQGSVEIFGTPHETPNMSAEELVIRDVYARVKDLAENSERIRVSDYIGRDALIEIYRKASVAVETMQYNLERELAFTTRTIEYLWCGLPVLYNSYSEISEHIKEYDAGWCVDPTNEAEIAQAIEEIFSNPKLIEQKSQNAKRLVQDRFCWDKTIQPLIDFLEAPVKAPSVQPSLGSVVSLASFLSPAGTAIDIPVNQGSGVLAQSFVVPAEGIKTVEVPVALSSLEDRQAIRHVELRLRRRNGKLVAKKRVEGRHVPVTGNVSLDFPLLHLPAGGTEYTFELELFPLKEKSNGRVAEVEGNTPFFVRGLLESSYPFVYQNGTSFMGRTMLGEQIKVPTLALRFLPGSNRVYRLKGICERSMWMIRQGQWKRLWRAGLRRIPAVVHRVRHAAFG